MVGHRATAGGVWMTRVKIWSEAIFSCWSSFYLFNLKIHPSLLVSSKSLLKTNEICWVGVFSVVGQCRKSLRTTAVNQVFTPKLHDEHYGVWCVMSQKECKSPKCDYESRIISLEHTHTHTCTKTHVSLCNCLAPCSICPFAVHGSSTLPWCSGHRAAHTH